jgi:hypothetical protein
MRARTTPDSGSTVILIAHLMDVSVDHEDEHLFPFGQFLTVVECDDHICDCREHIDFTYGDEGITQDVFAEPRYTHPRRVADAMTPTRHVTRDCKKME